MKIKFTTLLFTALLLAGCMSTAPTSGPGFNESRIGAPSNSTSVIYIFREYAEPYAFDPVVYVDGKELRSVPNRGFVIAQAAPGNHKISTVWPLISGQRGSEATFDTVSGKEYFVELLGVSRAGGVNTVIIGSGVHLLEEAAGKEKISQCCRLVK